MFGDTDELMYQAAAAYDGIVVNPDLSRQLRGVSNNNMVFDYAIVRHMTVRHNEAIIADYCFPFRGCSPVDSNTFADRCIIADFDGCYFTCKFQILRDTGNYSSWKNTATLTYPRAVQDNGMRVNLAIVAYDYVFLDNNKRGYNNIVSNLRLRMDNS
jgi:hypothetical protein